MILVNEEKGSDRFIYSLLYVCLFCAPAFADEPDAQGIRYGHFEVTYSPAQLLDQETIDSVSEYIGADEEVTWKMYVPESYDPDKPAGLMVYISPSPSGWMPRKWRSVIEAENFIWISANQSGNDIVVARRMLFAVLGPQIAGKNYRIDIDRIYLSGFSGGGKVASRTSIQFANLFKGAIYICGTEYWKKHPPALFEHVKTNRYVFLTGDQDFNLGLTTRIYRKYQGAGLRNIRLIVAPNMAHRNPDTGRFRQAIHFLDERG